MRARLPVQEAPRRRLSILLVASVAALVTGLELGARSGEDPGRSAEDAAASASEQPPAPESLAADLSLRQQVGQLVMLRFDGTELPNYAEEALGRGEAAGAILFGDNVASPRQLGRLTDGLSRAAGGSALVAADQEGGEIRIVPFADPEPSPATVARPAVAERHARDAASDLSRLGINVNLAPVADVASVEGSVMAGRAYPGDAAQVAELVTAAIRGGAEGGVASTAKHFPGIGAAVENTDDTAVTIERPRRVLERIDLEPFRAAIDADVGLVMASHALYTALDRDRIASQSRVPLQEVLREELGYDGVVITDSLEAEAVLSRMDTPTAAVRSIGAGSDLVLTTSSGSYLPVFESLLREARRDDGFRERVAESAGRVLALKEELGLEPPAGG